jgi:predicted dehydrogenase
VVHVVLLVIPWIKLTLSINLMQNILNLGIIGAENSHSFKIAEICNIRKSVPVRVTHIWGETKELAKIAAEKGSIPEIVTNWRKLAGKVDGVMIDHRHGDEHGEVARYFVEAGLPTFVDKPITCDLAEAKKLFALAERRQCPIITFSSKPLQKSFQSALKKIGRESVLIFNSSGPSDLLSKYGGVFFYGIHQVDCAVEVFGTDALSVMLHQSAPNAVATIEFSGGRIATLNLIKSYSGGFHWRFCTAHGDYVLPDKNDSVPYLNSARLISDFLQTGAVSFTRERMLAPIAILEALQTAFARGGKVGVKKL